jgi:hypothetical protein
MSNTRVSNALIVGSKCTALHDHSILIGMGLQSDQPYQLKVGSAVHHVSVVIPPESYQAIVDSIIDGLNFHG